MNTKKTSAIVIAAICCAACFTGCTNSEQTSDSSTSGFSSGFSTSVPSSSASTDTSSSTSPDSANASSSSSPNPTDTSSSTTDTVQSSSVSSAESSSVSSVQSSVTEQTPSDIRPDEQKSESSSLPEESAPVHTHKYEAEKTIEPSCTESGYTVYSCSCGNWYEDDYTYALGHGWSDWETTLEATSSREGEEERTCGRCGTKEKRSIPKTIDSSQYVNAVVELVNIERENAGLPALTAVDDLNDYAALRSEELTDNFAHERPDGSSPLDYIMEMGYHASGENIAMGYPTPEAVVDGWMNSSGHRANILSENYSYIGVGCFEYGGYMYWTQVFAG